MTEKKSISAIIVTINRKKDLIRCLRSLQASEYKKIEIIVVDNGSKQPVSSWLRKLFPKVKLIRSEINLGAAGGRNLGIKFAKSKYLLFMDDDAEADKAMIRELLKVLQKNSTVGIVHPKIYDMGKRDVLQGLGCEISLLTGRVSAIGIREKDTGQYNSIKEVSTVGCIWMVKRRVIEKIGGYDEEYFIPYEDLDFSFRARKAGFEILFVPKALAWHKGIKLTFINPLIDYIGIRTADRAYRIARNKIIFMRKFSPFPKNLFFFFLLMPIYMIVHSLIIIAAWRLDILYQYWLGVLSGLWYSLGYSLKYRMMVWIDPVSLLSNTAEKKYLVSMGLFIK